MRRASIVRLPSLPTNSLLQLLVLQKTNTCNVDIRTWFSNVEQHASEGVNKILIGNKCDWEDKRAVSTEQGQALADELGIPFLEVSAKSNINIEKAFYSLAGDIKKRLIDSNKDAQTNHGPPGGVNVGNGGQGSGLGGKCC
jgi:GTPase SAR1 family protein